jgi:hypothetical protein
MHLANEQFVSEERCKVTRDINLAFGGQSGHGLVYCGGESRLINHGGTLLQLREGMAKTEVRPGDMLTGVHPESHPSPMGAAEDDRRSVLGVNEGGGGLEFTLAECQAGTVDKLRFEVTLS